MSEGLRDDDARVVPVTRPASSPRPTFDTPTHIPADRATLHLWGDEEAGTVPDWIYVSSERIHHLVFALPPGGSFAHSDAFRTIFAADELMYVLSGTLVLVDPETGEVRRIEQGGAVFFRRDTWHHATNPADDQLRVLEFFAPPPAAGASSAYARTKELLRDVRYRDERFLGRWPMAAGEREAAARFHVLGPRDTLDRLEGTGTFVRTYASTEHLTAEQVEIRPGGRSATRRHAGDATFHVLDGTLNVLLTEDGDRQGRRWFELHPDDGFFVPGGTAYELRNVSGDAASTMFAVAPSYEPGD